MLIGTEPNKTADVSLLILNKEQDISPAKMGIFHNHKELQFQTFILMVNYTQVHRNKVEKPSFIDLGKDAINKESLEENESWK